MAKKKPNPDERPEEPSGQEPRPGPGPKDSRPKGKPAGGAKGKARSKLSDLRAAEMAWGEMLGRSDSDDSPRARALEILQDAFHAEEPESAVGLAKEALSIWPDCADAYVLLAEHSKSPKEALALYVKGVEAGARDLGDEAFRNEVGHFWGLLPSRPYMRARLGQAQVLWILGRRDEAIVHYRELLRLNPSDNQGVRYLLAAALFEMGHDDELTELLRAYEGDGSAAWAYGAALLAFRREGDTANARRLLEHARRANRHVPGYLLGRESLPTRLPEGVIRGEPSEAVDYAVGCLNGWRTTPGALTWLARSESERDAASRPKKVKAPKGPTPAAKTRLRKLPQTQEVWQADVVQLPVWVNDGDRPSRPWILVVASLTDGFILGQQVADTTPTAEFLWDELAKILRAPSEGEPRRPARLELGDSEAWEAVAAAFESIGIRCETSRSPGLVAELVRQLVEHIAGRPPMPGLLEMPGIRAEAVASFYQAAASYYRAAPWQRVGGSETIKIHCPRFESGPWYAVVIGQMGMTLGIALYDDLDALLRIRESDSSDEENARETVALSVTFGRENEVNIADLDASAEYGWEVAAPDAYPCPVRKERGMMMRPPLAWELQLLEAVLRAVPTFIDRHDRDDESPFAIEVPTGSGLLPLELSWVSAGRLL